jgi:BON domain
MSWRMSTRSDPRPGRPGTRWWVSVGVISAAVLAASYFLDPERGRGRRIRIAERTGRVVRRASRRAERRASYVRTSVSARAHHLMNFAPPEPAEGRTLLDRVESELFTDPSIPHGQLSFEVEDTTVVLRGELDSDAEIGKVETAVRRIPGVTGIRSLLHLPGTPAPNKAAALVASADAGASGGWPEEAPPDVDSES